MRIIDMEQQNTNDPNTIETDLNTTGFMPLRNTVGKFDILEIKSNITYIGVK